MLKAHRRPDAGCRVSARGSAARAWSRKRGRGSASATASVSRSSIRARRGRTSDGRRCILRKSRARCEARHDLRSLVLWGPGEEQISHRASSRRPTAPPPSRRQTTIADLVSLIEGRCADDLRRHRVRCILPAPSGTPLVGIFGPTDPAAQRAVGRGRSHRLAVSHVRVPLPAPVPHHRVVPARYLAARSDGAGGQAAARVSDDASDAVLARAATRAAGICLRRRGLVARAADAASLAIGGAHCAVGEVLRIWAAGHLEKGREVTQSGPYRLTRHPLYAGSAIIALGAAIAIGARRARRSLIAAYIGATLVSAIRHEEASMRAAFGDQYDAYAESRARPWSAPFSLRARDQEQGAQGGRRLHRGGDSAGEGAILAVKAVGGSIMQCLGVTAPKRRESEGLPRRSGSRVGGRLAQR